MAADLAAQLAAMSVDPDQFMESLTPAVRARVEALQELQDKHDGLEKEFFREKRELEDKYAKLYSPLYKERTEIVSGAKEPAAAAAAAGADQAAAKGVPGFWATVLARAEMVLSEKDADVLTYLEDITCEAISGTIKAPKDSEDEDGGEEDEEVETHGFKLSFHFKENPYFSNTTLTKAYHLLDDSEPVLEASEGCAIDWKAGKNVTVKVMKKKPKKGAKPDAKPQTKLEPVESFFNFFSPPQLPSEEDELDGEEAEALHDEIEADYDMGDAIRTKLIPRAVEWFTGEALDDEDDFMMGDEDEDVEDDDDDDDDDEEEHARPRGRGRGGRGRLGGAAAAGLAAGAQPQECKQQ